MNRYIGMDVYTMSCTVCVVGPSGRQLKSDVVETNGQALVEYLRAIPRPRHLCFEEGTQSAWLHEIISPHVDELVVVGVTESRGAKSDAKDALGLAQALRLGAIDTMVFKAPSRFARLRALSTSYDQITRDVTRTQTRIKALFRGRGIAVNTTMKPITKRARPTVCPWSPSRSPPVRSSMSRTGESNAADRRGRKSKAPLS